MLYNKIRTTEDMLIYITDCTLATVEYMASLKSKSKSKSEFIRQITIAQKSIDYMKSTGINIPIGERSRDVVDNYHGSVSDWISNGK